MACIGSAREKWEQVPGITDVRDIMEDRDGTLWVGGLQGLWHVRDGKADLYNHEHGLANDAVYDVLSESNGSLWLATYGGGLNRFRDGRFKAITSKEGLPNNMLVHLHERRGQLWVSSNQDIFRFELKQLNDFLDGKVSAILPVSYGIAEGMRSSESNKGSPSIFEAPDGRLWFATMRGVVAIDPMAGNRVPPPVVLEEARADTVTLAPNGTTSVPPGYNTLDFRFTALSFSAPEKVRFKYRLEPFDTNWVNAGTRRTVRYTNMAPGEYSFRVIAANSNGIWNETGAGTRFTLRPHFFQTNWFRAVSANAAPGAPVDGAPIPGPASPGTGKEVPGNGGVHSGGGVCHGGQWQSCILEPPLGGIHGCAGRPVAARRMAAGGPSGRAHARPRQVADGGGDGRTAGL